ncbi:hypothetical protein [Rhodococcus sp. NPDC060176]|uniref:hypothetical protein n=1 Tax=Rhodococcus sp. NPDC060176 TaxID=3347062 RepID=UPI003647F5FD
MAVSVKQAEQMWSDLHGLFVNAEAKIVEIIEAKAWEPLGYDSFAEAWQARMTGVRLSSEELRAHVVYAMFDEGLSESDVNEALGVGSGIGPASVKTLKQQRGSGVPPNLATPRSRRPDVTTVREHDRKKPGPPQTIHVQFPADEYEKFKETAARLGRTVDQIAHDAIKEAFEGL